MNRFQSIADFASWQTELKSAWDEDCAVPARLRRHRLPRPGQPEGAGRPARRGCKEAAGYADRGGRHRLPGFLRMWAADHGAASAHLLSEGQDQRCAGDRGADADAGQDSGAPALHRSANRRAYSPRAGSALLSKAEAAGAGPQRQDRPDQAGGLRGAGRLFIAGAECSGRSRPKRSSQRSRTPACAGAAAQDSPPARSGSCAARMSTRRAAATWSATPTKAIRARSWTAR